MEKKNLKIKNNFSQLISQVSKLYKEVSSTSNDAYLQGRKEAYEEMLNWFLTSHNSELKYVSANSFFNMIQEKLNKTKTAMLINQSDENEDDIKTSINLNEIKISDNRKRGRLAMADEQSTGQIILDENIPTQNSIFPFTVASLIHAREQNNINSFVNLSTRNDLNISETGMNQINPQPNIINNVFHNVPIESNKDLFSQNQINNISGSNVSLFLPTNKKDKFNK
jgi:hypothetical protein